ncbi:phage portal protein, partial [Escherichia coli]|nr:phage portal protein [Escherichia coli]
PAVVDAVKDKLIITDFKVEEGSNEVTRKAWQIWQLNKMPARSIEVHKEALKTGDAYVIVWPDELGNVRLYPQKSSSCTVFYDSEN